MSSPAGQMFAQDLIRLLRMGSWKLASAESCTGGALSAKVAAVPGASAVLLGGVVAYDEKIKTSLLGLPAKVLERFGVVSTEVTQGMARSVQALFGADVVCAVSGFFGPGGGTALATVGTVCATFLFPGKELSETRFFEGARGEICEKTVCWLLETLVANLKLLLGEGR